MKPRAVQMFGGGKKTFLFEENQKKKKETRFRDGVESIAVPKGNDVFHKIFDYSKTRKKNKKKKP